MSDSTTKKPRNISNFEFSSKTRRTLARLKRRLGGSAKSIVETALARLDSTTQPQN
jgi:hypothetical protein